MSRFSALLCILFFARAGAAAEPLEGVYRLKGSSPGATNAKEYFGKVTIEKSGPLYHLTWFIGASQSQSGVALAENDVLSVAYVDHSGKDFGVVSYKMISEKKLEGRWAPLGIENSFGLETLEFEKPLPPEVKQKRKNRKLKDAI